MEFGICFMALGISTVWKSTRVGSGKELITAIEGVGPLVDGIELEYRVPQAWYEEIRPQLKRESPRVLSIHNFFPLPEGKDPQKASGDLYFFTSDDPEERRMAVKQTIRTVEIAEDLGAGTVFLHLGRVAMDRSLRDELKALWIQGKGQSPEAEEVRTGILGLRKSRARPYFDRVLQALDRLNREAVRRGVLLGVENRYYIDEIPGPDEVEAILKEFAGGAVKYWHDVGHAHVLDWAGFSGFGDLLERYHQDLGGIHLHDARGYRDHLAPGAGEIIFSKIFPIIPPGAIRIAEIGPAEKEDQVKKGLNFLRDLGF